MSAKSPQQPKSPAHSRRLLRTLIVDDSVVFRSFLRRCLSSIDHIEVLGAAVDGEMAMRKIAKLKPDLVTLDMEMPRMHGIEVLRALQRDAPQTKVIVVSSETETNAERTLEALAAGACDFIIKPNAASADAEKVLTGRLRQCSRVVQSVAQVTRVKEPVTPVKAVAFKAPIAFRPDIIAIGSSTGGPAALSRVIAALPADLSVPVVITQHMPKLFVQSLASRLAKDSQLACCVAEDGMLLEKGHVYLAPGEIHMEVVRKGMKMAIQLLDGPKLHHCKPAVDRTFYALAKLAPLVKTLAVVLTGMGVDGADGAKKIKQSHGYVLAQDEASSAVWGMPGATVKVGAADSVLALDKIAGVLNELTSKGGVHATSRI